MGFLVEILETAEASVTG